MRLLDKYREQSRIKRAFILLVIVIIILMLIMGGLVIFKKQNPEPSAQNNPPVVNNQPGKTQNSLSNTPTASEQLAKEEREKDVRIIAEPFIERFGSYNNQDNFANMAEIEVFMTSSLSDWVNNTYQAKLTAEMPSIDTYYAINTKVLSSEVTNLDESNAEVTMQTQRQEVGELGVQKSLKYQEVRVVLIKFEGKWLVDAVYWK